MSDQDSGRGRATIGEGGQGEGEWWGLVSARDGAGKAGAGRDIKDARVGRKSEEPRRN